MGEALASEMVESFNFNTIINYENTNVVQYNTRSFSYRITKVYRVNVLFVNNGLTFIGNIITFPLTTYKLEHQGIILHVDINPCDSIVNYPNYGSIFYAKFSGSNDGKGELIRVCSKKYAIKNIVYTGIGNYDSSYSIYHFDIKADVSIYDFIKWFHKYKMDNGFYQLIGNNCQTFCYEVQKIFEGTTLFDHMHTGIKNIVVRPIIKTTIITFTIVKSIVKSVFNFFKKFTDIF